MQAVRDLIRPSIDRLLYGTDLMQRRTRDPRTLVSEG